MGEKRTQTKQGGSRNKTRFASGIYKKGGIPSCRKFRMLHSGEYIFGSKVCYKYGHLNNK